MSKPPIDLNDFPLSADGKEVRTTRGKSIASANSKKVAEEIANSLNGEDQRKEEDKWSA